MKFIRFNAEKAKQRKRRNGRKKLGLLLSSALAIPGILGGSQDVLAQAIPDSASMRFQYSDFYEYQKGGDDRMHIYVPSLWLRAPLAEKTQFEGSFVVDSISGASPQYHSSLTGASGLGIEDRRKAADGKVTNYFEDFSVSLGGVVSTEDDYLSRGGSLEIRRWSEDKNTTFAFGISPTWDHVSSTNDPEIHELKRSQEYLLGVTQIIDKESIIQSNFTYSATDGYLTDPYKFLDNRPRSRDDWAWLNRYIRYFEQADGSLHLDYRFFFDSWGITSHTIDASWYQPFGEGWLVRPRLRYYTQESADFFSTIFPPDNPDIFYSADSRMGTFGGLTVGLKLSKGLGAGFSADAAVNYMEQRPEWNLGGGGSDSPIEPFHSVWYILGVTKKF